MSVSNNIIKNEEKVDIQNGFLDYGGSHEEAQGTGSDDRQVCPSVPSIPGRQHVDPSSPDNPSGTEMARTATSTLVSATGATLETFLEFRQSEELDQFTRGTNNHDQSLPTHQVDNHPSPGTHPSPAARTTAPIEEALILNRLENVGHLALPGGSVSLDSVTIAGNGGSGDSYVEKTTVNQHAFVRGALAGSGVRLGAGGNAHGLEGGGSNEQGVSQEGAGPSTDHHKGDIAGSGSESDCHLEDMGQQRSIINPGTKAQNAFDSDGFQQLAARPEIGGDALNLDDSGALARAFDDECSIQASSLASSHRTTPSNMVFSERNTPFGDSRTATPIHVPQDMDTGGQYGTQSAFGTELGYQRKAKSGRHQCSVDSTGSLNSMRMVVADMLTSVQATGLGILLSELLLRRLALELDLDLALHLELRLRLADTTRLLSLPLNTSLFSVSMKVVYTLSMSMGFDPRRDILAQLMSSVDSVMDLTDRAQLTAAAGQQQHVKLERDGGEHAQTLGGVKQEHQSDFDLDAIDLNDLDEFGFSDQESVMTMAGNADSVRPGAHISNSAHARGSVADSMGGIPIKRQITPQGDDLLTQQSGLSAEADTVHEGVDRSTTSEMNVGSLPQASIKTRVANHYQLVSGKGKVGYVYSPQKEKLQLKAVKTEQANDRFASHSTGPATITSSLFGPTVTTTVEDEATTALDASASGTASVQQPPSLVHATVTTTVADEVNSALVTASAANEVATVPSTPIHSATSNSGGSAQKSAPEGDMVKQEHASKEDPKTTSVSSSVQSQRMPTRTNPVSTHEVNEVSHSQADDNVANKVCGRKGIPKDELVLNKTQDVHGRTPPPGDPTATTSVDDTHAEVTVAVKEEPKVSISSTNSVASNARGHAQGTEDSDVVLGKRTSKVAEHAMQHYAACEKKRVNEANRPAKVAPLKPVPKERTKLQATAITRQSRTLHGESSECSATLGEDDTASDDDSSSDNDSDGDTHSSNAGRTASTQGRKRRTITGSSDSGAQSESDVDDEVSVYSRGQSAMQSDADEWDSVGGRSCDSVNGGSIDHGEEDDVEDELMSRFSRNSFTSEGQDDVSMLTVSPMQFELELETPVQTAQVTVKVEERLSTVQFGEMAEPPNTPVYTPAEPQVDEWMLDASLTDVQRRNISANCYTPPCTPPYTPSATTSSVSSVAAHSPMSPPYSPLPQASASERSSSPVPSLVASSVSSAASFAAPQANIFERSFSPELPSLPASPQRYDDERWEDQVEQFGMQDEQPRGPTYDDDQSFDALVASDVENTPYRSLGSAGQITKWEEHLTPEMRMHFRGQTREDFNREVRESVFGTTRARKKSARDSDDPRTQRSFMEEKCRPILTAEAGYDKWHLLEELPELYGTLLRQFFDRKLGITRVTSNIRNTILDALTAYEESIGYIVDHTWLSEEHLESTFIERIRRLCPRALEQFYQFAQARYTKYYRSVFQSYMTDGSVYSHNLATTESMVHRYLDLSNGYEQRERCFWAFFEMQWESYVARRAAMIEPELVEQQQLVVNAPDFNLHPTMDDEAAMHTFNHLYRRTPDLQPSRLSYNSVRHRVDFNRTGFPEPGFLPPQLWGSVVGNFPYAENLEELRPRDVLMIDRSVAPIVPVNLIDWRYLPHVMIIPPPMLDAPVIYEDPVAPAGPDAMPTTLQYELDPVYGHVEQHDDTQSMASYHDDRSVHSTSTSDEQSEDDRRFQEERNAPDAPRDRFDPRDTGVTGRIRLEGREVLFARALHHRDLRIAALQRERERHLTVRNEIVQEFNAQTDNKRKKRHLSARKYTSLVDAATLHIDILLDANARAQLKTEEEYSGCLRFSFEVTKRRAEQLTELELAEERERLQEFLTPPVVPAGQRCLLVEVAERGDIMDVQVDNATDDMSTRVQPDEVHAQGDMTSASSLSGSDNSSQYWSGSVSDEHLARSLQLEEQAQFEYAQKLQQMSHEQHLRENQVYQERMQLEDTQEEVTRLSEDIRMAAKLNFDYLVQESVAEALKEQQEREEAQRMMVTLAAQSAESELLVTREREAEAQRVMALAMQSEEDELLAKRIADTEALRVAQIDERITADNRRQVDLVLERIVTAMAAAGVQLGSAADFLRDIAPRDRDDVLNDFLRMDFDEAIDKWKVYFQSMAMCRFRGMTAMYDTHLTRVPGIDTLPERLRTPSHNTQARLATEYLEESARQTAEDTAAVRLDMMSERTVTGDNTVVKRGHEFRR
eukprot:gene24916-31310_t